MGTWSKGIFDNGMAWSSIGDGDKVAILVPGGPGNPAPPSGWQGNLMMKPFKGLLDHGYRIVTVARKQNMPKGHSVADMAGDYAQMIAAEFNGQADLMVGSSYGGMIGQYIAAQYPDTFKHFVIMVAAYRVNPEAEEIDYAFAKALAEGRNFASGMAISPALWPDWKFPWMARLAGGLLASLTSQGPKHEYFANDVMVEVEAEPLFDSRDVLPQVKVPVLLIAGDQDFYFSKQDTLETQALIPDCQLRMYEGKGHIEAAVDKRIVPDILEFIAGS